MKLTNYKWYRNLYPTKTFVKVEGNWIDHKKYDFGKVEKVDGRWYTQTFCSCGNELVHSNSFIEERFTGVHYVYDYECSNCKKLSHYNPDIIPGLLWCKINGEPL